MGPLVEEVAVSRFPLEEAAAFCSLDPLGEVAFPLGEVAFP